MSHPTEASLLRYSDGELHGEALHAVETHLIGCRACRTRVVALEDESLWLADVLRERTRQPSLHAPAQVPEPGVALGVPIAIAFVTAVIAVGGALLDTNLPGGLSPLRLLGATEMAFDLIFLLRSRAPGLIELCFVLAAVVSVSALLSLAVDALGRRVFGATALLLCLLPAEPSHGFELRRQHDGDLRVGAGETVEGMLIASSRVLQVDGVVNGDLVALAERVTLTGTLNGNLYVLAERLEITGTVTGSVHGVSESLDVDGRIEGSLYAASDRVTLGGSGRVGRDVALATNDGVLAGRVGRDAFLVGDRYELRGELGRSLTARWGIERLILLDAARIDGNVDVWLADREQLEQAPGAQIAGEVRVHQRTSEHEHYMASYRDPGVWALHAVLLVASFLFGLLVYAVAPDLLHAELSTTRELVSALGWGVVALLVTPILLVAVALTLVGIPIALFGLFAYVTAIYLANIVVAVWIGRLILRPRDAGVLAFARTLGLGLLLVLVAEHIPYVGLAILSVSLLLGLGCLARRARAVLLHERAAFGV